MTFRRKIRVAIASVALFGAGRAYCSEPNDDSIRWTKIQLTPYFWSEAPATGDFNRDGKPDIAIGPYWFEGPDFKKRHLIYPDTETFTVDRGGKKLTFPGFEGALGNGKIINNTDVHFARVYDFNHDGWPDILVVGMQPGHNPAAGSLVVATWYENPGRKGGFWKPHIVAENVGGFDVDFLDLFGDGKRELVCLSSSRGTVGLRLGYFSPDDADATIPWTFHAISPVIAGQPDWWTHGLGHGDLNGDGKIDVLGSGPINGIPLGAGL